MTQISQHLHRVFDQVGSDASINVYGKSNISNASIQEATLPPSMESKKLMECINSHIDLARQEALAEAK